MTEKQKIENTLKPERKRIHLKWWQKLLLIAACTGLVVFGAWLYCEKIAAPTYTDTVRATLTIDSGTLDEIKSQRSEFVDEQLNIRSGLSAELNNKNTLRNRRGNNGAYYWNILTAMYTEDEIRAQRISPEAFGQIIHSVTSDSLDSDSETILIQLNNSQVSPEFRQSPEAMRALVLASGSEFAKLIFGQEPDADQATITYLSGAVDESGETVWSEADPHSESAAGDLWQVKVTVKKAAIDALPNSGSFYAKTLDLVNLLETSFTDADYQAVIAAAGVEANAAALRSAVRFPLTGNEEGVIAVDVSWDSTKLEEARKLAKAAAQQSAKIIFRTLLGSVDDEANAFRYNSFELSDENYTPEPVVKAGGYRQTFYSDRPQFKTSMSLTGRLGVLNLAENCVFDPGLMKDIAKTVSVADVWTLTDEDIANYVHVAADPEDATGKTLLITVDPELRQAAEVAADAQLHANLAAADQSLANNNIDEDNHSAMTAAYRAARDEAVQAMDTLPADVVRLVTANLDTICFGYLDTEKLRTVDAEGRYTVTQDGVEALSNDFFTPVPGADFEHAVAGLAEDSAFWAQVSESTDADTPEQALRESMNFTAGKGTVTLQADWTDKTTTEAVSRAVLAALSTRVAPEGVTQPTRIVTEKDDLVILREQARKSPPATLPTMVIAGLIALVLSYMLFSQQSVIDSLIIIFFVVFTFICVFPFYYLFINTISDNNLVAGGQINFLPRGIHFTNYGRILGQQDLGNAIIVTVSRTILGTALMVLTSAWAGYLVTKQKMWRRSFWYRALVITMYFNAGLIPWYTNMLMLGLTGNFLAYIIPGMVAPYNIILVKTYIESIPGSLEESAIIDGATTFKVFIRIILPLSVPILATIAIFGAVGNWNSFQDSLLLMSKTPQLYTLQHRLYIYLNQTTAINTDTQVTDQLAQNLANNGVTTKYTIAMITIIPILLVYPIMQRYFVKGIMLGAVKG